MFRSGSFGLRQRYPFLHPLTRGTYPRRDPQRSGHTDESIQKRESRVRCNGKRTNQKGGSTNAPQQDVPHFGQQHRYGYPTKHHGLRRNRTYLRSGSGHPFHRHRIGSRSLERYPAQSVRPRPLVLQPPHRPGIPGSEEKLSFRSDFGYAVAGANFHSDGRRRIILPPIILLHVRNQ